MRTRSSLVVAFILATTLVLTAKSFAGPLSDKVRQNVRVVSSPEARGDIDPVLIQHSFWLLMEQQGLAQREPPRVLVLHVSRAEAAVAGVNENIIRFESVGEPSGTYYQVWLIDEFKPAHYLVAFQAIIRRAFDLRTSELDENAILSRVLRIQNATISARKYSP